MAEKICFGDMPINELMHTMREETVNEYVTDEDSLAHYGILGMKWGVRRYQNKDGTLTATGKKRQAKLQSELDKLSGKKDGSDSETSKPKSAKDMTNEELIASYNRLVLERNYRNVYNELNPKKVSAGKEFMKKLGKNVGDAAAEATRNASKSFMEKKFKELLGVNDEKTENKWDKLKKQVDHLNLQNQYKNLTKDNSTRDKVTQLTLEKQLAKLEEEKKNDWK